MSGIISSIKVASLLKNPILKPALNKVLADKVGGDNLEAALEIANVIVGEKPEITLGELAKDNLLADMATKFATYKISELEKEEKIQKRISQEMHSVVGKCPECGCTNTLAEYANNFKI